MGVTLLWYQAAAGIMLAVQLCSCASEGVHDYLAAAQHRPGYPQAPQSAPAKVQSLAGLWLGASASAPGLRLIGALQPCGLPPALPQNWLAAHLSTWTVTKRWKQSFHFMLSAIAVTANKIGWDAF